MGYSYNEKTGDFERRPAIRPAAQVPPRKIVADTTVFPKGSKLFVERAYPELSKLTDITLTPDSLSRTIVPVRPKPALSEYDRRRIEELQRAIKDYKPVQPQPTKKSSDDFWGTVFCIVISIMILSILF